MSLNGFKARLKRNGGYCAHPKCSETKDLTADHIIPKQFLETLGFDEFARIDEDNLQILCKRHNNEKGNRLDYTNPRTLPLLKKYVNMWIEKHSDFFIPVEKRVRKIGVVCKCCERQSAAEVDLQPVTGKHQDKPKSAYTVDGYTF